MIYRYQSNELLIDRYLYRIYLSIYLYIQLFT
jgi:hypothetical protein